MILNLVFVLILSSQVHILELVIPLQSQSALVGFTTKDKVVMSIKSVQNKLCDLSDLKISKRYEGGR